MDMRQVRHFIAVAEHGNVLRAADAIHISQPALSKSIQNLESELDVPLLHRGPRGVSPTIYGTILLKHAKLLRNQAEQAVAEIRAIKEGHTGHLRLGVANFAIEFLPRVVAKLLEVKPGLSFEIVDGTYEGLTALLRDGALDAVVSGFPPLHQAEDLVHEQLVATEFLLVCRPDHPLVGRTHVSLQDLGAQRWILANRPQAIIDLVELAFRTAGAAPPKPLIQSGSMIFLKAVLMEGQFLTFLPRGVVAHELETGQLVWIPLAGAGARTTEGIIYRAGAIHPPALFALVEAIKAEQEVTEPVTPATTRWVGRQRSGASEPSPRRAQGPRGKRPRIRRRT